MCFRRPGTALHHLVPLWILLLCPSLLGADSVTGTWKCIGKGLDQDDLTFVLDLKQSGDEVTGSLTVGDNTVNISRGLVKGDRLELVVVTDDNRYTSDVVVEGNRMTATWKDETNRSGTWQGERQVGDGH